MVVNVMPEPASTKERKCETRNGSFYRTTNLSLSTGSPRCGPICNPNGSTGCGYSPCHLRQRHAGYCADGHGQDARLPAADYLKTACSAGERRTVDCPRSDARAGHADQQAI